MGSINKSHNEADGGILLFNGELILLYCDSIQCEVGGKESVKGRVYLTTHRMVMLVTPYNRNSPVKSLCAPFCAITKCSVEQPLFSANYIEATVRDEADPNRSFTFKLKFAKGGAIEFALAMNKAVAVVGRNMNPSMVPPPAYTPTPSDQYYQAPPTVYAPGYNSGIHMPVEQFPDQPPIGFIYTSSAPPPYPGLSGAQAQKPGQGSSQYAPPPFGRPNPAPPATYPEPYEGFGHAYAPPPFPGDRDRANPPAPGTYRNPLDDFGKNYPHQPGQPSQPSSQPGATYPSPFAPGSQPPGFSQGYPGGPGPLSPPQPYGFGQPGINQGPAPAYPDLSREGQQQPQQPGQPSAPGDAPQQAPSGPAWPSAPAFNPHWQDDKKSS